VEYREHAAGVFLAPDPADNEPGTLQQNIDSSTSGIQLSALGILPLSYRWEVYARGGVLISNNTASVFVLDDLGNSGKLRSEYQRVFDAGEQDTLDEADVDLATFNVSVSF